MLKRRQAVEPSIGHLKADHRMRRNVLKGALGDAMTPILAAAGFNIRRLMLWLVIFWRRILSAVLRLLDQGGTDTRASGRQAECSGSTIEVGDVKSLLYATVSFDGYWSFGVIEHFWDSYDKIFAEGSRVIKPSVYFMLKFPMLLFLRRLKAKLRLYKNYKRHSEPEKSYKFFMDRDQYCYEYC